jgi:hypothetical protein
MFPIDQSIIPPCEGCGRIQNQKCTVWLSPAARFHVNKMKDCGMSTHISGRKREQDPEKKRIGQQKQRKKKRK